MFLEVDQVLMALIKWLLNEKNYILLWFFSMLNYVNMIYFVETWPCAI